MRHPETIDIEYVGDPPIMDELVVAKIASGEITDRGAAILRQAEMSRLKAIPGVCRRIVDVASFHTSREYIFGPHVFTVAVDWEDAKKIMDSESGNQFRIVGQQGIIIPSPAMALFADEYEISKYDVHQRA